MSRKTDEERAEIRRQRNVASQRARMKSSGIFTGEDRKVNQAGLEMSPSLLFTITQDEIDCPDCGRKTRAIASESGLSIRKIWRCPHCRWTMSGQYKTYVIEELPG